MRKTFLWLVAALALLMALGGVAAAQDFPPTFCGDLPEADCALLRDSAEAMKNLESAAFTFQLDLGVTNIPETDIDSLRLRLSGDGAYAVKPGALDSFMVSPTNMTEMMQTFEKLPEMMEEILTSISGDINLVIDLPQNLPLPDDQKLPERVGFSARLVDGVGYINLDKLAALDRSGEMPRGWVGLDLVEFFDMAFEAQQGEMSEMFEMMQPGTGMTANFNAMQEMMSAFTDPEFLNSYMSISRAAGTTIDGQEAAVFETTIDLGALYGGEHFRTMMRQQIEAMAEAAGEADSLSEQDFEEFEEVMNVFSTLFDGFVINMTQTIGLDDHYIHQTGMSLDWALDFSKMASAFGGVEPEEIPPPMNLSVSFTGELSQFNNAPEITAPEGAMIVPTRRIFRESF